MNTPDHPSLEEVRRHWGLAVDIHRRDERLAAFDRLIQSIQAEALIAVAELHEPDLTYPDCPKCAHCSELASTDTRRFVVLWPCDTVAAMFGVMEDDA